jgi:hypothetical protein
LITVQVNSLEIREEFTACFRSRRDPINSCGQVLVAIGIVILVAIDPDRYGWIIMDKKGRSARKEIEDIRISDLKGLLRIAGEGSI